MIDKMDDQILLYYHESFICLWLVFHFRIISMLTEVTTLPPGSQAGFHDYLTGAIYSAQDGNLVCDHPTLGKHTIPLHMSSQTSSVLPDSYLHKMVITSGKGVINPEGTVISSSSEE